MNQDRRGTRFEFGPSPKRSRPNENGDDADDQIRTAFHQTFDSRNEKEPRLRQALTLSSAQLSTRNPTHPRPVIDELYAPQSQDPWKEFKPLLHILQGAPAVLAQSIPPQEQLYAIRSVDTADKDKHLRSIQQLSLFPGGGIDRIRDIFDWAGKLFIVTEYVRPNLSQIITCETRPTEAHLAFIAHRILGSLVLLEERGLVHGSLTSTFVLIPSSCIPVLAHPPCWRSSSPSDRYADTAALANLLVRLMDKSAITGSTAELHLKEPHNWSSEAVNFIECARKESATSLRNHSFLKLRCEALEMYGLRAVAEHTTWSHWQFLEPQEHKYNLSLGG